MSWLIIIVRIPLTSGLYAYMPYPSCYIGLYIKSEQDLGFNPFNAELLGTLASPPLNSWGGGGVKKNQNIL